MVIVFDTTVLALSLVKLVALWRSNGRMSNLVRTLFRKLSSHEGCRTMMWADQVLQRYPGDQIIFYILTFTVNVVNITVYYVDRAGGVGKDFIAPVAAGITSMAVSFVADFTITLFFEVLTSSRHHQICRVVLNLRREAVKQPTFVSSSRSRREGKASNQHLLSGAINVPGFPASELSSITANRVGQATPKYQSEILRDIEKQEKCDGLAGNWDEAHDVELDRVSK